MQLSKIPIIQAPMAGGITTARLIAAVSNAGGLGSVGAGYMQPDELRCLIQEVRALTDKPFSVNLFVPQKHQASISQLQAMQTILAQVTKELEFQPKIPTPPYSPDFDEQLAIVLAAKVPVVSFTFGIPDKEYLAELKRQNIIIIGTATSVEEAILWQAHSADMIVVQGAEAGGHRGTFAHAMEQGLVPLMSLIPQVKQAVSVPIIAAGGLMLPLQINKAFSLGVAAVQVGTAFITTEESGASMAYQEALLQAKKDTTVLTKAYSGKYARGLANQFTERMQAYEKDILDYPIQNAFTAPIRKAAGTQNNPDFLSLFAGQGVQHCKKMTAAQLIKVLMGV